MDIAARTNPNPKNNSSSSTSPTTLEQTTAPDLDSPQKPQRKGRLSKVLLLFIFLLLLCCPPASRTIDYLYYCKGLGSYLEELFLPEDLINVTAPPLCLNMYRGTPLLPYLLFGYDLKPRPVLFHTCLSDPNSKACQDCQNEGLENQTCKTCEDLFFELGKKGALNPKDSETMESLCTTYEL